MKKMIEQNIGLIIIDKSKCTSFKEKMGLKFVHMSHFFRSKHRAKLATGLKRNINCGNIVKCISKPFPFPVFTFHLHFFTCCSFKTFSEGLCDV